MLREGAEIRGRYRLVRSLDRGGMGLLWEATDLQLGHKVAIKFPSEEVRATAVLLKRFKREARLAVRIGGPNVITILDEGEIEEGYPYIVMERLEGCDLSKYIDDHAPLDLFQAADVIVQIGRALGRAHDQDIVHRDVTPRNIFVTTETDGKLNIKVLDFGIAKDLDSGATSLTRTAVSMGSLRYMSPEQLSDMSRVSASADIWALNIVIYEMLTGKVPFDSNDPTEFFGRLMQGMFKPATELNPRLPASIDAYFTKAFKPKKDDRFPSIEEMNLAFGEVLRGAETSATLKSRDANHANPVLAVRTSANLGELTTQVGTPRKSNHLNMFALAALVVVLMGVFFWRRAQAESEAQAEAEIIRKEEQRIATEIKRREDIEADRIHQAELEAERARLEQIRIAREQEVKDRIAREEEEAERRKITAADAEKKRLAELEKQRRVAEENERKRVARLEAEEAARAAAWSPASESVRGTLLAKVKSANEAERLAFRKSDPAPLYAHYTGAALKHELNGLAEMKKVNRYVSNELISSKLQAVELQGNGNNARVRTTETWQTSVYDQDSQRCMARSPARAIPQTIYLALSGSQWRVSKIDHAKSEEPKWTKCE